MKIVKHLPQKDESVDTVGKISATTMPVTSAVSGVCLIVVPISAGVLVVLPLGNKVNLGRKLNKYKRYKKQFENDQKSIESFKKLNTENLQEILIDRKEHECLCKKFKKFVDEKKNESL